jgi:hypothetical protein
MPPGFQFGRYVCIVSKKVRIIIGRGYESGKASATMARGERESTALMLFRLITVASRPTGLLHAAHVR